MLIKPAELAERDIYRLMIGSVVPRPISWTSTVSADGVRNLAPIGYFSVVSHQPPMVSLTIEPKAVSASQADAMLATSAKLPPETDEFAIAGVAAREASLVSAPLVADSLVGMECLVRDILTPGSHAVVWGAVVAYHFHGGA